MELSFRNSQFAITRWLSRSENWVHPKKRVEIMVKDPVCGMDVDERTTRHLTKYNGRTYYVCSSGCKAKFEADPGRYLSQTGVQSAQSAMSVFRCPMHPHVTSRAPGRCP